MYFLSEYSDNLYFGANRQFVNYLIRFCVKSVLRATYKNKAALGKSPRPPYQFHFTHILKCEVNMLYCAGFAVFLKKYACFSYYCLRGVLLVIQVILC